MATRSLTRIYIDARNEVSEINEPHSDHGIDWHKTFQSLQSIVRKITMVWIPELEKQLNHPPTLVFDEDQDAANKTQWHQQMNIMIQQLMKQFDALNRVIQQQLSVATQQGDTIKFNAFESVRQQCVQAFRQFSPLYQQHMYMVKSSYHLEAQVQDQITENEQIDEKQPPTLDGYQKFVDESGQRSQEIESLAETVTELHNLFKQMSWMILQQGEIIERIDIHVEKARDATQAAAKSLEKAEQTSRSKNFYCCCIGLVLISIVLIVCLAVKVSQS